MKDVLVPESLPPIEELLNPTQFDFVVKNLLNSRRVSPEDEVSYTPVETEHNGIRYLVKAAHVSVDEIRQHGQSSCKKCIGKGYSIVYLDKSKIPNPQDYVILSEKPIETMTEEEKKLWIEVEKKKKLWKVLIPCKCAIKRLSRLQRTIVSNQVGNIVAKLSYERIGE
jgi:hypothetical protein